MTAQLKHFADNAETKVQQMLVAVVRLLVPVLLDHHVDAAVMYPKVLQCERTQAAPVPWDALCIMCLDIYADLQSIHLQVMRLNVDAHVLMALAGVGSFWLGAPLEGALLFVLFHMAHALEAKFVRAAHTSLTGLLDAVPATANVVVSGKDGHADWASQTKTAVAEVPIGALVVVKPGEAVPLDGVVLEGQALVGVLLNLTVSCFKGQVRSMRLLL
jgi:cation transport ATPase